MYAFAGIFQEFCLEKENLKKFLDMEARLTKFESVQVG